LVREFLPLSQIQIRHVDALKHTIETVVVRSNESQIATTRSKAACSIRELETYVSWHRDLKTARTHGAGLSSVVPEVVSTQKSESLRAGPLGTEDRVCVLILIAEASREFEARHERLASALLEPLSVAFENDQRLRELVSLREAVEADNRSLLSRLDRHDISDSIVGADTGLKHVMEQIELVARADAPVLVLGETGSGKEVVARAIHTRSARNSGPFLRVNCGAIPPELIDSELFGHERGSFTGAVAERKGWFERADGGTLFLDECGELPPAAQVRLLRILQDGQYERVGSEKTRTVDIRIVAATHRNLTAMVSQGQFRQDLWYRLAIFPIQLPPLRERITDIPALASHFALRAARRLGLPTLIPSASDIGRLVAYEWPGNVRELASVIERAAILGGGRRLDIEHALGTTMTTERIAADVPSIDPSCTLVGRQVSSLETLDQVQRRHIEKALACTSGRIEGRNGAALLLQINPHTLRSRMRRLRIQRGRFLPDSNEPLGGAGV
jgi:transcriptional regulator with GAF, ATPase, and Fis domain